MSEPVSPEIEALLKEDRSFAPAADFVSKALINDPGIYEQAARDPEAYVDFTASEMPLTRLAEMFDDLFPGQILIPAEKLGEMVTTDGALRRIKLADLVEHVGMVPRSRPLRRTTST